ncbi:hypothetical protein SBOR_10060 [Sclerotinia borealis F-4128]|uniref:Nascent polypeptide-associated complex subunit alpha-like UBA domain-containing protein n=1 Tax=Sclerotinia borealis (strain F-4128) TaxID=1432307 RepID=W9C1F5_SCLBF|nr:hypothetical protein SBOR_10060 [Sclerotinia borealis F-4128]
MSESQPPTVVEGATTGDVDDEIPQAAKSAEDRKAAAALSSLDAPREDDSAASREVDHEAVRKAMDRLAGKGTTNGAVARKGDEKKVVKKTVKVEAADVNLLVEELELTKIKATDLLKAHDGDAMKALKAYITPVA